MHRQSNAARSVAAFGTQGRGAMQDPPEVEHEGNGALRPGSRRARRAKVPPSPRTPRPRRVATLPCVPRRSTGRPSRAGCSGPIIASRASARSCAARAGKRRGAASPPAWYESAAYPSPLPLAAMTVYQDRAGPDGPACRPPITTPRCPRSPSSACAAARERCARRHAGLSAPGAAEPSRHVVRCCSGDPSHCRRPLHQPALRPLAGVSRVIPFAGWPT